MRAIIALNPALVSALMGWFVAQALKVIFVLLVDRKWDISRFFGSGGMPSSHSSFVTSLATAVGMTEGFQSGMFAVAACFAFIVMYDAAGVRREAGSQARLINQILRHLWEEGRGATQAELKELIGHTPYEVLTGGMLGIFLGIVMNAG